VCASTQIAEHVGVDARFVRLWRDPLVRVASRLRQFPQAGASVATRSARVAQLQLEAQLACLDARFLYTLEYTRAASQVDELASFLRYPAHVRDWNPRSSAMSALCRLA
jgi:hypothetical protein